jgi:hypothetical protein
MNDYIIWFIAGFGLLTMVGVFCRIRPGFGPFNLRAVGIVLVATFAALLALKDANSLTATMGILGGIAGYLFGIRDNHRSNLEASKWNSLFIVGRRGDLT